MFESTNRNGSVALTCLKQTSRKLKEFMLQNKLELMSGVTDVLQNFCLVMFFVFSLKTYSKVLTWHGSTTKRAMDGIKGTLKNVVFRKVKSVLVTIHTLFEFYQAAVKFVLAIKCVYLAEEDISEKPEHI